MAEKPFLIGAFGVFWSREQVEWKPGGGASWQLLGKRGQRRPGLRVCDFRNAQGFYLLYDDHGPTYVGLARGASGIGQRLQKHDASDKTWSRFSWFSFDGVVDSPHEGWAEVKRRKVERQATTDLVLKECEALLIHVLGTARVWKGKSPESEGRAVRAQVQMQFQAGAQWEQLQEVDAMQGGVAHRVAPAGFTDAWYRKQVMQ